MNTLILKDNREGIEKSAQLLRNGGIVAIPTETVYGLSASAFDSTAVSKVFKAKGRPQDNPLIVHVASIEDVKSLTSLEQLPKEVLLLAEKFWPGPLTMVLPKSEKVPPCITAGLDTVAIRMPENEVAREIIKASGLPLAAPSANLSGKPSPTSAQYVIDDLSGKVDGIVCSGDCSVGVESTVVSLFDGGCRILRPGGVTAEMLKEVLPNVQMDDSVLNNKILDKVSSPGMKYKHYAPDTNIFLVEGDSKQYEKFMQTKKGVCAICFEEDKIKSLRIVYGSVNSPKTLAQGIFSALREVDNLGVEEAYVHAPSKEGIGLAVYNRLLRSAEFKVIKL